MLRKKPSVIEKVSKATQKKLNGKVFQFDLVNDIQKSLEIYRATHQQK